MQAKSSQAECLLLYKINWSTEGTEGLVEKKKLHLVNKNLYQNDRTDYRTLTVQVCIKRLLAFLRGGNLISTKKNLYNIFSHV